MKEYLTDPINLEFEKLVVALDALGEGMKAIAIYLGISVSHLSRVQGGERHATKENVEALKDFLTQKRMEVYRELNSSQKQELDREEIQGHKLNLVSTHSNEIVTDEQEEKVLKEAQKSTPVKLPKGIKGAVVEKGTGRFIVMVDSRLSPADFKEALKHETNSINQGGSNDDDLPPNKGASPPT